MPRSLFRLSSGHVHVDAVKKCEDGSRIVLRFHEFAGQRGQVELTSGCELLSWQECDLMERPTGELISGGSSDSIRLAVKPYEIKTLLIDLA
jgi:alpha-mannosidase